MKNEIVFYTNPMSRGRLVHWMLEEVGAPYEVKLLNFEKKEHKAPEYLAINPMGKVPAIQHRGVVITESPAIIAYLADAFPEAELAPAVNSPERGAYYRWFFFGNGCVEPAIIDKMLARPPAEKTGAVSYGTYEQTVDVLEATLKERPFLLGDKFSAADLYISSQIGFGIMTKSLESKPAFQHYLSRCTDRPAHQRFMRQSDEWWAKLKANA